MASLTTQWADIIDPAFRRIFHEAEKQIPSIHGTIFNMLTSDRNNEKVSSASGLSKLVTRAENAAITYEDELQGYDVNLSVKFA